MVQQEIESWFSSDNEQDDTRTQCYKQSCKEYYRYARKMGLQLEDVLKEKGEVQPYADILYQKRMNTNDADSPEFNARSMFNPSDYYDGCVEFRSNGDMVGFRD